MHNTSYDFIIAGAGASGLSLVWYMMQSEVLNTNKLLLMDLSLTPTDEKTWCFWEDSTLPQKEVIHHSWNTLLVRAFDNIYSSTLERYTYHCIRSLDYSRSILNMAQKHPNITLLETSIDQFGYENDNGIVYTKNGNYSAKWVFQSALKPRDFDSQTVDISLKQHFMGIEIETKEPVFDPDKVILMDFDTSQEHGVTFFYVLPFSKTRALVEYTFFTSTILSEKEYSKGINNYLKIRYDLDAQSYTTTRTEMGAIPMEDRKYSAWYCNRVLNIGTVGGLTKPSTGYTFTRIHRHSKLIVKALENDKKPPSSNQSSYRFRVYDIMLLHLLDSEPKISKKIFHDLFKKNSFDKILQFLGEDTHPWQELSLFASLPHTPFLKAIYRMKHRIFTGA